MMAQLNWLVDNLIWAYASAVLTLIFSFWLYKEKTKEATSYKNVRKGSLSRGSSSCGNNNWETNWREYLKGHWKQVDAENLDNFGLLSNQSKIRRTLGSLAFFRVRHRISYQSVMSSDAEEGSESSGGTEGTDVKFCLLRDLGEGMQEWRVEAVIGTTRDTAEPVEVRVDTPGYEKMYRYRVWVEDKPEGEGGGGDLLMESEPVEADKDSIKTLQVRSLVGKNRMKMVTRVTHLLHECMYVCMYVCMQLCNYDATVVFYFPLNLLCGSCHFVKFV
jgi:hypothetical protein